MNEGIIVFRHSFNEAVEYKSLITKVRAAEDVPVILVANKVFIKVLFYFIIKVWWPHAILLVFLPN